MKWAILVSGPNATGKTTAVSQALAPWTQDARLLTIYADNSNRSMFKGTQTDMEDLLLTFFEAEADLLVVEGTNRIAMAFGRVIKRTTCRQWEAHLTKIEPWFLKWALETRCQKLGKRFRDDYWNERVLRYETTGRFTTINSRWLDGKGQWWPIADRAYTGLDALQQHIHLRAQQILAQPDVEANVSAPAGRLF